MPMPRAANPHPGGRRRLAASPPWRRETRALARRSCLVDGFPVERAGRIAVEIHCAGDSSLEQYVKDQLGSAGHEPFSRGYEGGTAGRRRGPGRSQALPWRGAGPDGRAPLVVGVDPVGPEFILAAPTRDPVRVADVEIRPLLRPPRTTDEPTNHAEGFGPTFWQRQVSRHAKFEGC